MDKEYERQLRIGIQNCLPSDSNHLLEYVWACCCEPQYYPHEMWVKAVLAVLIKELSKKSAHQADEGE